MLWLLSVDIWTVCLSVSVSITGFLIDCLPIDIFLNSIDKGSVFYYFPDPRFYLKGQHL